MLYVVQVCVIKSLRLFWNTRFSHSRLLTHFCEGLLDWMWLARSADIKHAHEYSYITLPQKFHNTQYQFKQHGNSKTAAYYNVMLYYIHIYICVCVSCTQFVILYIIYTHFILFMILKVIITYNLYAIKWCTYTHTHTHIYIYYSILRNINLTIAMHVYHNIHTFFYLYDLIKII